MRRTLRAMRPSYLTRVGHFVVRRTFALTDAASVLLSIVVPAVVRLKGDTVDDDFEGTIALGALVLVAGIALLRLVTAPYFIWKEQNAEIDSLTAEIAAFKAAPGQRTRTFIEEALAQDRLLLVNRILEQRDSTWSSTSFVSVATETADLSLIADKLRADPEFVLRWQNFVSARLSYVGRRPRREEYNSDTDYLIGDREYLLKSYVMVDDAAEMLVSYLLMQDDRVIIED